MEVQFISRKLIKPSVQTPPHLQNQKISFFDQIAPPLYVPSIYYYPNNNHEIVKKIDDRDTVLLIQQLEQSLSEILTLFYPLSGRYIHDNLSVVCDDQGVELVEAKVDIDLTQIIQQGPMNPHLLNNLIPAVSESDTSPLIAIQINRFKCGGLATGLFISHRVADISTVSTFINAWATKFRELGGCGISDQVRRPSFDLGHLFPQREDRFCRKPPPPPEVQPKSVVRVFEFTKDAIDKLKSQIRGGTVNSAGAEAQILPSRIDVVFGLIWRTLLIGSAKARGGHLRASTLSQQMNLRGRLSMPLPENACGNLVMPLISRFSNANDDQSSSKLELSDIVSVIRDAKRKAISDCAKAGNNINDVFSMVTNAWREVSEEMNKGNVDLFLCTSWSRMGLEEANFGWGKPAWVSSVAVDSSPLNVILLKDTKSGDGIEAWMCLKEVDMLHFQQDPDILQALA